MATLSFRSQLLSRSLSSSFFQAIRSFSKTSASCEAQVNGVYQVGLSGVTCKTPLSSCNQTPCICSPSAKSQQDLKKILQQHGNEDWTPDQILEATRNHSLFTWGASKPMGDSAITIDRGEGVYFYDANGKRYLDFNSQAMCLNLGHTPPAEVMEAIQKQLAKLPYAYTGIATNAIRAKLSSLLASICPGDINAFLFPSSGAEANETALRIARVYTGRHKVLSRYRSYHGSSVATLGLTGDQRRWPAEAGANGHVHFIDPFPYSFSWGSTEEEITQKNLTYLKEVIDYEGPQTIAAIFLESMTGTNGILKPPKGYLEGVRELCDTHGILMVCDEVMGGFGRSGRLFAFCHAPGVIPDLVTFAKGVNGAYIPLGGVGMRQHLADYFRTKPLHTGSTYNSHPVALASAYASLRYLLEHNLIQHAANMQSVIEEGMRKISKNHPSVKQCRVTGLFGCFDIARNKKGDFIARVTDPLGPAMQKFRSSIMEKGLWTMMRGHTVFCNPPLIIQPEQIREAFSIFDQSLSILDDAMEDR